MRKLSNKLNLLDTQVDVANKIISTTVNHFSDYFVIDSDDYFYDIDVLNANSKIDTGKADVVFTIDTTGSMGSCIANVKNNINAVVDKLKVDNVDVRLGLVGFKDITYDGLYSTKDYGWFTSVDDFKNAINALYADGGGDWEESDVDGLEVSREKDFRSSVNKYMILFTDAPYKNGTKDNPTMTMDSEITLLKNDNISVSVVTNSTCKSVYEPLYTQTNGIVADISGIFAIVMQPLIEKMATISNEGAWIRLSNGSIVHLDKDPSLGDYSVDTDKDGIPDLVELGSEERGSYTDEGSGASSYYQYWNFKSNAAEKDTDGDGIDDDKDLRPCTYDSRVVESNDDYIVFNTGDKWEKFGLDYFKFWGDCSTRSIAPADMLKYSQILRDNQNASFSSDELAYTFFLDKDGVRSYLTYEGYQDLAENVFRIIKGRPSTYLEYDSSDRKWKTTLKTEIGFWDEKVLSQAQLLLTFDNQASVNFNDIINATSDIAMIASIFLTAGQSLEYLNFAERFGCSETSWYEELVFTGGEVETERVLYGYMERFLM